MFCFFWRKKILVRTKNASYEQKNLHTNKKIFEKWFKIFVKISEKKVFGQTEKFSVEDFFVPEVFMNIRKNENLRNKDLEILFLMKTILCQFHKTRTFVFSKDHSLWPLVCALFCVWCILFTFIYFCYGSTVWNKERIIKALQQRQEIWAVPWFRSTTRTLLKMKGGLNQKLKIISKNALTLATCWAANWCTSIVAYYSVD